MNSEMTIMQAVKKGFTLIELLVVVAILGILATGATLYITDHMDSAKETAAKTGLKSLDDGVTSYKMRHSKLPKTMKDLIEKKGKRNPIIKGGEGAIIDPWGNEYQLKVDGKEYYILSFGPDALEGTEDDIRSDRLSAKKEEE